MPPTGRELTHERSPIGDVMVGSTARTLGIAAAAYLVFVVYGSLVPLNWTPTPFAEAWRVFEAIPYLRIGAGNRADWVANILLMVPFAFLFAGAADGRGPSRPLRLGGVILISAALAVAIEFVQVFFPPRTVSVNDIAAETIGAVIGVAIWAWQGPQLCRAITGWARATHPQGRMAFLFYGYVLTLTVYNLLPFDLTLSLSELYGKLRSHRVVLVPFSFHYESATDRWLDIALDLAAWIPVGLLARFARVGSSGRVLLYCAGLAALLEFLQLFVLSRVSDLTDVLMATVGAGIGIGIARALGGGAGSGAEPRERSAPDPSTRRALGAWVWAAAYAAFVLAALWYPYDFRLDPGFVRERYAALWSVPLEKLYFQSEFRAISNVVLKAGLFLPLGALIALAVSRAERERRAGLAWAATIFVALLAFAGELGQVLLPGKYPDISDVLLSSAGAFVGALLMAGPIDIRAAFALRRRDWAVAVAYLLVLALVWTLTHWPGAPYNVRELLRPGIEFLSAALLAAAIVWICAFPSLAAWSIRGRDAARALVRWPLLLLAHAVTAYVLLALAVPEESIGDLVGSPVLGLSREGEYLVRSTVLCGTVVWLVFLGSLTAWSAHGAYRGTHGQLLSGAAIVTVFILPLAHWVIVVEAATDNLVELMRDGGGPLASVLLAAFLVLLGATGAWVARLLRRGPSRAWAYAAVLVIASTILGYGLLLVGTEQTLFKYGKVFSALQFLLSMDRDHYLTGGALLLRFAVAYAGATAVVAVSSWPVVPGREAGGPFSAIPASGT